MLGSILVRVEGRTTVDLAINYDKHRIIDYLTDVEVILNGSHPCKDLSGKHAQAITFLDQGVFPDTKWNEYGRAYQKEYFLINFGRKLMDRGMGLNLADFDNVQLRLTNDASSSHYGEEFTVSTLAYFKEGDGGFPLGYMKSEQFKSWTSTLSTWEYTDLPTEGKLRRLILRLEPDMTDTVYGFETSMDNMGRDIKITFDSGATVVYEGGIDDLMREICLLQGRNLVTHGISYHDPSDHRLNGLGRLFAMASGAIEITANTVQDACLTWDSDYDRGSSGFANTTATQANQMAVYIGTCPHACLEIPFIDSDDPADWLDLAERKTMKVDIHHHSSGGCTGGACSIVLERQVF